MHVHLEPVPVQLGDGGGQQVRLEVGEPVVVGVTTAAVAVRLEQCARVVLHHPIGHDLDAGPVEPCCPQAGSLSGLCRTGLALAQELADLVELTVQVPPQGTDDTRCELAGSRK